MWVLTADPATERAPEGWEDAVRGRRAGSLWSWPVLRILAWSAPTPTIAVAVGEPDRHWRAHFHFRMLGAPAALTRFSRRLPPGCIADCRIHPNGSLPGYLFLGDCPAGWRAEAIAAARAAVGGIGRSMIAFRNVSAYDLCHFGQHQVIWTTSPDLVIENRWPTVAAYAESVGKRHRSEVRRVGRRLAELPGVTAQIELAVPADQASLLVHDVLRRHRPNWWSFPPLPTAYFDEVTRNGDAAFLTYRRHGQLLALTLMHDDGADLTLSAFGQCHESVGVLPGFYLDLLHRSAIHLVTSGRRRLLLGKGMETIKQRFGAVPQPTFIVLTGSRRTTGSAASRPAIPDRLRRQRA